MRYLNAPHLQPERALYRGYIVKMLKDAMEAGNFKYDTKEVPKELIQEAADLYQKETGNKVLLESTDTSEVPGSASSSDAENLQPNETFMGSLEKYVIDCRNKPNKGFVENLSRLTDQVNEILRKALKKFGAFRFYMEYVVLMERLDCGTGGTNEREVTLSTSGEDGALTDIRKYDDIENQVGICFAKLLARVTEYAGEGSGWNFVKSLELRLNVSKQIFGVTRQTHADDESLIQQVEPPSDFGASDFSADERDPDVAAPEEKGKEKQKRQADTEEDSELEKGGSYIPLPAWVRAQGACVNPKPNPPDNRCFEWCILRAFNPLKPGQEHPGNVTDLKEYAGYIRMPPPVMYPIPMKDRILRQIEEMNDFSFSIFRIGEKKGDVSPMYITENKKERHIQLGLISKVTGLGENYHFVLIRGMSRLFPERWYKWKRVFCERCLTPCKSEAILSSHMEYCGKIEPTKVEMPTPGGKNHFIKFDGWKYCLPQPWVVYADFEAVIDSKTKKHSVSMATYHIRCGYGEHLDWEGFNKMPLKEVRSFIGKNALDDFLKALLYDAQSIYELAETNIPCEPTEEEWDMYNSARTCHICKTELRNFDKVLDHDHYTGAFRGAAHNACNLQFTSSKYFKLPVFFHNLKGYDGNFVMRGLAQIAGQLDKIDVIAKNLEKFTTISVERIRFVDSMQFLTGSLENLVKNYREPATKLKQEGKLKEYFEKLQELFPTLLNYCLHWIDTKFSDSMLKAMGRQGLSESKYRMMCAIKMLELVTQKGIYPYEWMDSFKRLDEKQLPPKEKFYSELQNQGISDADYAIAQRTWQLFKCQTMGHYTELYCAVDVLLLETLFENFRKSGLQEGACGLDAAHFITAPSMSWQAMLKMNFEKDRVIENMTDPDMLLMVENGIRGGMCQVMKPFGRANPVSDEEIQKRKVELANDELLVPPEDSEKDSRILYWDANNLYGWAMSQPMPIGNFYWDKNHDLNCSANERFKKEAPSKMGPFGFLARRYVKLEEGDPNLTTQQLWKLEDMKQLTEGLLKLDPLGPWGYTLEVDISYPKELHDTLNDYPPCPTHKAPTPSPFTQREMRRLGIPWNAKRPTEKLIMDLERRTKYVIHFRSLQQALQLGMVLEKVHRVIAFQQSPWLADYIGYNTEKRKLSKNSIEKDYWKLLNNSIFGKTIEQVRKRRNIKFYLAKDYGAAMKQVSGPFVKTWRIIEKDKLIIMEMAKSKVVMNRPIIIGQAVLDVSKWLMFDFHYNYVRKQFDDRAKLLYTDTDSMVYYILAKTWDSTVNQELVDMQVDYNCFDLSEMKNASHPLLTSEYCAESPKAGTFVYYKKDGNKAVLGKFKDEMAGMTIAEFAATRSKMYSVLLADQVEKMRKKGIPEKAVLSLENRKLTHEDFFICLMGWNETIPTMKFNTLKNTKTFEMETKSHEKKGLSACDDKSFYLDPLTSFRYGHYALEIFLEEPQRLQQIEEEQQKLPLVSAEEPLFDDAMMEWLALEEEKYNRDPMNY